jgi:hypothetical protein
MAMAEDHDEETPLMEVVDPELRQLLGLFDVPAFARRGQDLEFSLANLHARLRRERLGMLGMVRLRLRQWAAAVEGPDAWTLTFASPIAALWELAEADTPAWAVQLASERRRRAIARDLVHSIQRFNRRWSTFLAEVNLGPVNELIDQYNRYYVLEKECSLGSVRLAARHFSPRARVTHDDLDPAYPPLPVPVPRRT